VSLTFAGEDVRVVPVSDGDQAVEALKRSRPDVVIADVAMPGRSGYDLAEYIRQSTDLADIPVLLLGSAFDPVDPARAQAVGARGVLTKPFAPAAIVGRVRELLGAPVAPATSSEPAPAVGRQSELDEYFERIDRAFAELKATKRNAPEVGDPLPARTEADSPTIVSPPGVSLPDAFSAMLAAESGDLLAETTPLPAAPAEPGVDMDALVDRVVARVLAALSDRVVRDTVADIVSSTAERLVGEAIERIRREAE
jgi:CheY-like chemotaxis protein